MRFSSMRVEITPQRAAELLALRPPGEGPLSTNLALRYAQDMREGKWTASPASPILLSADGQLVDGRLRLLAVIVSGTTQPFTVSHLEADERTYPASIGPVMPGEIHTRSATGWPGKFYLVRSLSTVDAPQGRLHGDIYQAPDEARALAAELIAAADVADAKNAEL